LIQLDLVLFFTWTTTTAARRGGVGQVVYFVLNFVEDMHPSQTQLFTVENDMALFELK
jgi:hypothetical protein